MMTGGGKASVASEITYSQTAQPWVNDGEVKQCRSSAASVVEASRLAAVQDLHRQHAANNQDDWSSGLEAPRAPISASSRPAASPWWVSWSKSLPILLLIGVSIFVVRQMQVGRRRRMGFGKNKAKL